MIRDPSSKVLDAYSALYSIGDASYTETAEFGEHIPGSEYPEQIFWYIKIWRNNVLSTSQTRPSQVHVGQRAYVKRLWLGYKKRRGL